MYIADECVGITISLMHVMKARFLFFFFFLFLDKGETGYHLFKGKREPPE
mgnify:CR=1 FL=1